MDENQPSRRNAPIDDELPSCETCRGYGFRVQTAPGRTINAISALENGLMSGTARILCHCQPVPEKTVPAFEAAPKPAAKKTQAPKTKAKNKKTIVAGIKPSAYVDPAPDRAATADL